MAGKKNTEKAPAFEERMTRLKELVERLEATDVPLEESVELYKEGRELVLSCRKQLEQAMTDVRLLADDGTLAPFVPEQEDDSPTA